MPNQQAETPEGQQSAAPVVATSKLPAACIFAASTCTSPTVNNVLHNGATTSAFQASTRNGGNCSTLNWARSSAAIKGGVAAEQERHHTNSTNSPTASPHQQYRRANSTATNSEQEAPPSSTMALLTWLFIGHQRGMSLASAAAAYASRCDAREQPTYMRAANAHASALGRCELLRRIKPPKLLRLRAPRRALPRAGAAR